MERSEIAVVLSTNPAFKLKAGVGSEPRDSDEKKKVSPPTAAGGDLFWGGGTGSRRGLRRVFLGGDGGARQAGTGGPSSVGIVHWSDLLPPHHNLFAGAVSLLPSVSGLFWCGTLFSVPSQSQFRGGKCARWLFFVRLQRGPRDGTEANLAPCQRSDVSIAAG